MFNDSTRNMLSNMGVGLRVDRPAAALGAATVNFFTVTGVVQITGLYGIVTVAAVGITTVSWQATPTAGTNKALCAGTDIDTAAIGDLLGITGVVATALTFGGAVVGIMQPLIVTAGTIDFISSAASGTISTHCFFLPMSAGANVVIA